MLERRLDNVVFRLGFAASRREARQMVGHGHIQVNGRKVSIPSFIVKVGEVVQLRADLQDAGAGGRQPRPRAGRRFRRGSSWT